MTVARRLLLALATGGLPSAASGQGDPFAAVEALWAARLRGRAAIRAALGAGPLRPAATSNEYSIHFLADLPAASPYAALDLRLDRKRPLGIAALTVREGRGVPADAVRARYGPAQFWDVRPELPLFYLRYDRPGGALSFGFPKGQGGLANAVVDWGPNA